MGDSQPTQTRVREDGVSPNTFLVRYFVRHRSLLALPAVIGLAALLAGCATDSTPAETATPGSTETAAAPADLCDAQVASGAATDALVVDGEPGTASTLTFEAPLEVSELQAAVVSEGAGQQIAEGDLITYAMSAFDATTGTEVGTLGYQSAELLPAEITAASPLGQLLGCASVGDRVVAAFPASDSAAAQAYIIDVLGVTPKAAWGTEVAPTAGAPVVTLAEDGTPTIDTTGVETPTTTEVSVLKEGDGDVVADGDEVLVQYTGVLLDGTEFDSSWSRGAPTSFNTQQVVDGFGTALVGQKVGSQVVAVIPPAEGYGDTEQGSIPAGSTLVFVVDILGTQHAVTQ